MKRVNRKISCMLMVAVMLLGSYTPVLASSNIMNGVATWRYQTGVAAGTASVNNAKIKADYDANGILNGLYLDPNGTGNFSAGKMINDFNMQIVEGGNTYDSDNVSVISENGTALNGYDQSYDFFKRRMSEFYFNGINNNRYISTMYTEFLQNSDILYMYPRLHVKENASPSNIKYNFKFPSTKFDKIYYDVQPQQILQDDSYVNQGGNISFKGDNLLNASGSFEKVGGWNIRYTAINSDKVSDPRYELTGSIPGWTLNGSSSAMQQVAGGHDGNYSLKLTNNQTDYSGNVSAKFDVQKGDTYTVSAWVKASGANTSAKLWVNGYGTEVLQAVTTGAWTRLSMTFSAPIDPNEPVSISTLHPSLYLSASPGSSILVDGVKVELGSSPTAYGNNMAGLSTSTVLYNTTTQEGLVIYTPLNYPELRKWYSDDYVRKSFMDYSITRQTVGSELVLTYDVTGQAMSANNTEDFYFYVRPFKGSVIDNGISAFTNNLNTMGPFQESFANVTTLNKQIAYYPIEGYADQFYSIGFTTLHKGKAVKNAPWNDATSSQDWGINGERGFNWGFNSHNMAVIGNSINNYYRRTINPTQAMVDERIRFVVNYIDKTNDTKYNGVYTTGGMPNYKLLIDLLKQSLTENGQLAEGYNNFYFAQVAMPMVELTNQIYSGLSAGDKAAILSKLGNLKKIYDKTGIFTWNHDVNALTNGDFEQSAAVTSGSWTTVGNVSVTSSPYTVTNTGTNVESNYVKSSFTPTIGSDYSSQVSVKSNLAGGAKVWLTSADNPVLIDSTPLNNAINGNVEAGTLSNWTVSNQGTGDTIALESTEKHGGSYSVKYTHLSTNGTAALRNGNTPASSIGKKYKATAWVKSADNNPVNVTIDIAGGKKKTYTAGNTWTQISTVVYASTAFFTNVGLTIPQNKAIYVDDVVYTETAEDFILNDDDSNGDAEAGSAAGWDIYGSGAGDTLTIVSDVKFAGNYAMKYTHGSANVAFARNIANVASTNGKKYKGSAWVRSADANPVDVTIHISGVGSKTFTVGSAWTPLSTIVDVTNEYYNTLAISIPSGKSVYIDNAVIGETSESVPINEGNNGGAESGNLTNWSITNPGTGDVSSVISTDKHAGNYAVQYTRASSGTTTYISNVSSLSSVPGKRYKATAWVKSPITNPLSATIDVSGAGPRAYTVGSEWTQISTMVNASNGYFNTVAITIPAGRSILIDDVVLMEVSDQVPVYSVDINQASFTTVKSLSNAAFANDTTNDLKLFMRPGDQVIVNTPSVQQISGWTANGRGYTEISNDYASGAHSLTYRNDGANSKDNFLSAPFTAGTGFEGAGTKYVASAKVKAKAGTTAKVWLDSSGRDAGKTLLNDGWNGDLEYGNTANWEITNKTVNDTMQVSTTHKTGGSYGLQYTSGSANAALRYSFPTSGTSGKSYKVSMQVKSGSGTANVTLSLGGKQTLTYNIGTGWREIYTIVENADPNINRADIKIPSGQSVYIDDLKIEETTDKLPLNASNNEGVEENSANNWAFDFQGAGDTMTPSASESHSGIYAMSYTHGSANQTTIRNTSTKPSITGRKYKATAWVKSASSTPIQIQIHISGAGLRSFMVGNGWTPIYTYATATNPYYNSVGVIIPQGNTVYIDDMGLVETDETDPLTDGSNSGGEAGLNGNWGVVNAGSGDSIQAVTGNAHMGAYSLKYTYSSGNAAYAINQSNSASVVGKKYRGSIWAKNANPGNTLVTVSVGGVGPKTYSVGADWVRLDTYVTVTNTSYNSILVTIPQGSSVYLDDSEIVETTDSVPLNFWNNGDLETGTVKDFTMQQVPGDSAIIESAEKHSGNYSIKFTVGNASPSNRSVYLMHLVSNNSVPGKRYKVTAWVKSATGSNVYVNMSLSGYGQVQSLVGNTWTKLETTVNAENPNFNQVNFILGNNTSIYVDDVSVTEVDATEPIQYYNITDSSWTSIVQKLPIHASPAQALRLFSRPGDEILIDTAQVEPGEEASSSFEATSSFYDYSPLYFSKSITVINSHIEATIIAAFMKKIADAAGNSTESAYWNTMTNNGVDGILWFMKKNSAFSLNDLIYRMGTGPNGEYGKYVLMRLAQLFNEVSYKKSELQPYVWHMVNNYIEDDKDDHYAPTATRFSYEIAQILYGIVWNDATGLRTIESNWPTYYPAGSMYDLRAFRLNFSRDLTPILDDKWYYGFTVNQTENDSFGGFQLSNSSYYLENSTDTSKTVTIAFVDRDTTDSYGLSRIAQALELITNTPLTISGNTVTFTIPARTFRIVQLAIS
ncbi:carbohydrate binding domain-containing protein [Cohnella silvisoli]|uniref:Carbohydrate binding domain-containing protein n=1 Tax=Cohnella silvisoli TaxID=2873699 RepID=A0ABV1L0W0_9BACL|nr:carbohydrate binding domain-containing protein [Cohnella silvisoli]MCD9025301.1 carbohydrate binding domain-containing protein [Cohnella silvisoli]